MTNRLIKIVLWLGIIFGAFIASPVFAAGFIYNGVYYEMPPTNPSDPNSTPNENAPATPVYIVDGNGNPVATIPQGSNIPPFSFDSIDNQWGDQVSVVDRPSAPANLRLATTQELIGAQTRISRDSLTGEALSLTRGANGDFGLECGILGDSQLSHCIPLLGYYLLYVPSIWVLTIAGLIFDALTAFSLSSQVIGGQSFVESGWTVVRNISNLVFIFFLLYIAIKTILGLGDWKKSVVPVILVALLINFSLFFTKIVIDASNILAYQFYNSIGSTNPQSVPVSSQLLGFDAHSISQHLVAAINPQSLVGITSVHQWTGDVSDLFFVFLATAVIMVSLAYVLFKAAFLMLGRLIAFWFLMMFSPLAFLGFAFPQAQSITGQWMKKLTDQALVAPVFLFFLYMISFMLTSGVFSIGSMTDQANITSTTELLVQIVLKTAIFVALMMYALKVTKDLSGEFGTATTKYLGGAMGIAAGGVLGATAIAGRATLGRMAQRTVDSGTLQQRVKQGGASGWIARQQLAATKGVAGGSMDFRTTGLGKSFGKSIDIDLGEGKKGGFTAARDEQRKKDIEYAKSLEVSDDEKLGRAKTQAKADEVSAKKERQRHDDTVAEREKDLAEKEKEYQDALDAYTDPRNAANAPELKKKLDGAEQQRTMAQGQLDAAKAAQKTADDTVKAAGAAVKAAEKVINEENDARRGAYANTVESRGSGVGYAVNLVLNPSHSGVTARDTANKIRTGTKPSYKSKGDSGKDSERIVSALEELTRKLAEQQQNPKP